MYPRDTGFPVAYCHCPLSPSRLSLDNTEAELHSLFVRTRSLKENIRRDEDLCQQMQDFLQVCGWLKAPHFILQQLLRGWLDLHGCVWGSSRSHSYFSHQSVKGTSCFSAHSLLGCFCGKATECGLDLLRYLLGSGPVCHCSIFTIV